VSKFPPKIPFFVAHLDTNINSIQTETFRDLQIFRWW